MTPLSQVIKEVQERSEGKADFEMSLQQLAVGLRPPLNKLETERGEFILTPNGFEQLRRRIGLRDLDDSRLSAELKLAMIQEAIGGDDSNVILRVNGNHVDSILSDQYRFFDNTHLVEIIEQLMANGDIPQTVQAMTYSVSPDGRQLYMRLTDPDNWNFEIQERKSLMPFLGNLVISNNEYGTGAFNAKVAVTRTACFNSTMGQRVWSVNHKGKEPGYGDFIQAMLEAFKVIKEYSLEMKARLEHMMTISIQDPALILKKIGEENHVPKYALAGASEYWEDEGRGETLYDVVQALAAGIRAVAPSMTEKARIREVATSPNFEKRFSLEGNLWDSAGKVIDLVRDGHAPEVYYMTEAEQMRNAAASYAAGFSNKAKVAATIAEGIRHLEPNLNMRAN